MPPRRPLSSRAEPEAKRGGRRPAPPVSDDDLPEASASGLDGEYKTGGHYPDDDEDAPLPPEEGDLPAHDEDEASGEDRQFDEGDGEEGLSAAEDLPPGAEPETRAAPVADSGDDESSMQPPSDATRAGPPTKVQIIGGPDEGKVKRFNGVRLVVGRTAGCDLKLTDASVSRRHLELVQGEKGVLMRDLGSGNGTKVNGEKVEEQLLEDGDEIALGKTVLKFIDEMAAFKKAKEAAADKERAAAEAAAAEEAEEQAGEASEVSQSGAEAVSGDEVDPDDPRLHEVTDAGAAAASGRRGGAKGRKTGSKVEGLGGIKDTWDGLEPKQRLMAAGGAAGAFLFLLLIIYVAVPKGPPAPDPRQVAYDAKLELVRSSIDADDFQDAVRQAEQAQRIMSPSTEAKELAAEARRQLAAKQTIDSARSLAEQGKLDEAEEELLQAGASLTEKRSREKAEVEKIIADKRADFLGAQVETALESRDVGQIRLALEKLPMERRGPYEMKLRDLQAELEKEELLDAKDAAQARVIAAKRAAERRSQAIRAALDPVERKFGAADYARASKECDRVIDAFSGDREIKEKAKSLKNYIPAFEKSFEDGKKKVASGALESAVRPLRKAKDLYALIGFIAPQGKEIHDLLATAAIGAGRSALARGDLATANGHFKDALKVNPSDARGQEGLEKVVRRAKDLYLEGYMVRDRDPREAKSKFRTVLDVLPRDEPEYQKAKAQLDQLGP